MKSGSPQGWLLLLGIASLRPPNQKRSDLFNPFSISATSNQTRGAAHV